MTIVDLKPVGWNGMTPRQWRTVRNMIREVSSVATMCGNLPLMLRAEAFLIKTEGFDV